MCFSCCFLVFCGELPLASVCVSHVQYYSLRMAFPKGPHLAKLQLPLGGALMPGGKFAPPPDRPITLDRAGPTSTHQQLSEQLRRASVDWALPSGTGPASTRRLGENL